MDHKKVINLILNNPANHLTTTSIDLLETMSVGLDIEEDKKNQLYKEIADLVDCIVGQSGDNPEMGKAILGMAVIEQSKKVQQTLKDLEC